MAGRFFYHCAAWEAPVGQLDKYKVSKLELKQKRDQNLEKDK